MKKILLVLLIFSLFSPACIHADEEKESTHDYLYSEEYFDYLIECAHEEAIKQKELEEVKHQLNEFNSRIRVLKKRMKPLIAYLKVLEKNKI